MDAIEAIKDIRAILDKMSNADPPGLKLRGGDTLDQLLKITDAYSLGDCRDPDFDCLTCVFYVYERCLMAHIRMHLDKADSHLRGLDHVRS